MACYSGNVPLTASSSTLAKVVVPLYPTIETVTTSSSNPNVGQTITLTVNVSSIGGVPTGQVTLYETGPAGNPTLSGTLTNGECTFSVNLPTAGAYTFSADYFGNSQYIAGVSPSVRVTAGASTTTTLSASPASGCQGTTVRLSSTVTVSTGGYPAGTVTFTDVTAGRALGTFTLVNGGCSDVIAPTLGAHQYTASYNGAAGLLGSSSGTVTVNISNAPPTVAKAATASPSAIYATIPGTPATVDLSVLGADDGGESNLKYNWSAAPGPSGTSVSISSNNSNAAKNTVATLNGFAAGESVIFTVTITDAQGLSCMSRVTVEIAPQNSAAYPPAVAVVGIRPTAGPLAGGTLVTIAGAGFTRVTQVHFGGILAKSFVIDSDTQIMAWTPAVTSRCTVDVTVSTPSGTSAASPADQFTYMAAPTVSGISPASGPVTGGTSVTITGTGFNTATSAYFGTMPAASIVVNSATTITATAPAVAPSGVMDVTVSNPGGTSSASAAECFTYTGSSSPIAGADGHR